MARGAGACMFTAFSTTCSKRLQKHELIRPGFVRVSLNYYWDSGRVAFVADALEFIAMHGWKLLPE